MGSERWLISFRPVSSDDLPLIAGWMRQPHWREWWGRPEEELALIEKMVEGEDTTRPFLICADGVPVGYIQYWLVADNNDSDTLRQHPWLATLPEDAVGVDISIGDAAWLSRGLGPTALRRFISMLRDRGYQTIVIDPHRDNKRAIRAYEKAGFAAISKAAKPVGDVFLMQYQESNL